MATCRQIITDANRALGVLPLGSVLSADQASQGLDALTAMYGQLVADGKFGGLTDVLASGAYEAAEGERVTGGTVTLPTTVTENGEDRAPKDKSVIVVSGATPQVNLYDADLGSWTDVNSLGLDDPAPFSNRNRLGLAAMLAVVLSGETGLPVPEGTALLARQGARALFKRDPVQVRAPNVLLRLSRQTFQNEPS